jgi:hypothetical protein
MLQTQEKEILLTGSDEMDVRPEAMLFSRRITFMVGNPNSLNPPLSTPRKSKSKPKKIKKLKKKSQNKKKRRIEREISLSLSTLPLPLHKTEKGKN